MNAKFVMLIQLGCDQHVDILLTGIIRRLEISGSIRLMALSLHHAHDHHQPDANGCCGKIHISALCWILTHVCALDIPTRRHHATKSISGILTHSTNHVEQSVKPHLSQSRQAHHTLLIISCWHRHHEVALVDIHSHRIHIRRVGFFSFQSKWIRCSTKCRKTFYQRPRFAFGSCYDGWDNQH